jgi:hypothetical protein
MSDDCPLDYSTTGSCSNENIIYRSSSEESCPLDFNTTGSAPYPQPIDETPIDILLPDGRIASKYTVPGEEIANFSGIALPCSPFEIVHNTLLGIQGGQTDQYYHLTYDEYEYFQTINVQFSYIGENYTLLSTTENISANLQNQIDNIVVGSVSIESSGGSIIVTQDDTTYNIEVASSPIQNHNDLIGLQGGTVDEYYHLTEDQYNDYIGATEVESISSNLQSQINAISGSGGFVPIEGVGITIVSIGDDYEFSVDDYVSNTEVVNISSNLQNQINNISISGSGLLENEILAYPGSNIVLQTSVNSGIFYVGCKKGTNYKTAQLLAISDGTTTNYVEESSTILGSVANISFTVDYNSGLRLNAIVGGSNTWVVSAKVVDLPFTLTPPVTGGILFGQGIFGSGLFGGNI